MVAQHAYGVLTFDFLFMTLCSWERHFHAAALDQCGVTRMPGTPLGLSSWPRMEVSFAPLV